MSAGLVLLGVLISAFTAEPKPGLPLLGLGSCVTQSPAVFDVLQLVYQWAHALKVIAAAGLHSTATPRSVNQNLRLRVDITFPPWVVDRTRCCVPILMAVGYGVTIRTSLKIRPQFLSLLEGSAS